MDQNKFKVFDKIRAEEALKEKTKNYLYTEIRRRKTKNIRRKTLAFCASAAAFFFGSGFSYYIYFTPDAYIDLDVNPSIELTLNRFERVIASGAYNDDGAEILSEVSVRYKSYSTAVESLLEEMNERGYIEEGGLISATVQAKEENKEKMILAGLQETVEICCEEHHNGMQKDVFAVTEEIKRSASEAQVSPAKYIAIQNLLAVDESASFDACKEHSVHELQQLTEEHNDDHENYEDGQDACEEEDYTQKEHTGGEHKHHH